MKFTPYPSINTLDLTSNRSWTEDDNYKYYIEEKIDGSQISIHVEYQLLFYNKNKLIHNNSAFEKTINMLRFQQNILNPNYIYHGEAVSKIKHNVCVYERTPKNYFILYDIFDKTTNSYLSPELKKLEADRVNMEIVPILYYNNDINQNPYEICTNLIEQIESHTLKSCLGGQIEGIVLKHHAFIHKGIKVATKLKLVTSIFKERHLTKQPKAELSADEFLLQLGNSFCTEARFNKAFQHLVENNAIDPDHIKVSDQNKIIMELNQDFDKEYKEELKELLYTEFSPLLKKLGREGINHWFNKMIK